MSDINLYGWAQGKQRKAVIIALSHPMTPTQTQQKAKELNPKISINNTSDILRSLVGKGLAECLNSEAKTGRIYKLTQEGEEIRRDLMKG